MGNATTTTATSHQRILVLGGTHMDRVIKGVFDYAQPNVNWRIQVAMISEDDPASVVRWHKADGVIVSTSDRRVVDAVYKATPNLVAINLGAPHREACCLMLDEYAVGRCAAEHLLEFGHRQYAFYGWDNAWARKRLSGFAETVAQAGYPCEVLRTSRGQLPSFRTLDRSGSELVKKWIARLPRPTGIMLSHDSIGFNLLEACELLGRSVPDDLAVVGVDNSELVCLATRPTLSSVDLNLQETGYQAAQTLDRLIHGENVSGESRLVAPRGVATRQSTDRHMFDDDQVNLALQFIRDHAQDPIDVEDVLDHVEISRSSLESRFRKYLGHTPGVEIRRVRLNLVRKYLLDSNLSLVEIAVRCGFSSISYLSQAFKREYKVSPNHYRAQQQRKN